MTMETQTIAALRAVIDPDLGIDIVELGLVESIEAGPDRLRVGLIMTTPACPQTAYLQDEAAQALAGIAADIQV